MKFAPEPCPEEQAFKFQNGARAHSLAELKQTIQTAPAPVLEFHKAHFHYWIKDVVQDPQLAEKVKHEGERAQNGEQLRGPLTSLPAQPLPPTAGAFGPRHRRRC